MTATPDIARDSDTAKAQAGSVQRVVSRPVKNPNLVAFLQGYNAFESDAESGEITDCPYQTRLARRDWWRGYHHAERTA